MANAPNQKLKQLYLMKILLERTDEEHIILLCTVRSSLQLLPCFVVYRLFKIKLYTGMAEGRTPFSFLFVPQATAAEWILLCQHPPISG
ncbi:MAG: hypothetical protein LBQ68_05780 [Clostridiales bacterium]|nr:hypothetical protein [Clostridiales bacterium]